MSHDGGGGQPTPEERERYGERGRPDARHSLSASTGMLGSTTPSLHGPASGAAHGARDGAPDHRGLRQRSQSDSSGRAPARFGSLPTHPPAHHALAHHGVPPASPLGHPQPLPSRDASSGGLFASSAFASSAYSTSQSNSSSVGDRGPASPHAAHHHHLADARAPPHGTSPHHHAAHHAAHLQAPLDARVHHAPHPPHHAPHPPHHADHPPDYPPSPLSPPSEFSWERSSQRSPGAVYQHAAMYSHSRAECRGGGADAGAHHGAAPAQVMQLRSAVQGMRAALSDGPLSDGVAAADVMGEMRALAAQLAQLAGGAEGAAGRRGGQHPGKGADGMGKPRRSGSGRDLAQRRSRSWESRQALEHDALFGGHEDSLHDDGMHGGRWDAGSTM